MTGPEAAVGRYTGGVLLLLAACQSSPADTGPDTAAQGLPVPEAVWTAAQTQDALTSALSAPLPGIDRATGDYLGLMARGDSICPGDPVAIKDGAVYGCDANTGMYYAGVSEYWDEQRDDAWFRSLAGDFLIQTPEGQSFEWGMGYEISWGPESASMRWLGSLFWDGDPASAERMSVVLAAGVSGDAGTLNGGITQGETVLDFDLETAADCPAQGLLAIRGPDKRWYRTTLGCNGCGPLSFEGQELGEVCVDPSPLVRALHDPLASPDWEGL